MQFVRFTTILAISLACTLGVTPAAAQPATGIMTPVQGPAGAAKAHGGLAKSDEFASAAAAAAHCPNSSVVWSSLNKSHSFHTSGSRYFGKTKHGAYLCRSDALAAGYHQAKN